MKINGWKRVGIIASVVWMVSAGLYTLNALSDRDERSAESFYSLCVNIRDEAITNQGKYCHDEAERSAKLWYDQCIRTRKYCAPDPRGDYSKCMTDYEATYPDHCSADHLKYSLDALPSERTEATVVAVVPVPFGWGFAYLVLFLVRWVKRGLYLFSVWALSVVNVENAVALMRRPANVLVWQKRRAQRKLPSSNVRMKY
jgi:hypothetical protein